jgi:hypothetical protein
VNIYRKVLLIAVCLPIYAVGQQPPAAPTTTTTTARPRFLCNTGYSIQTCNQQVAVLRRVLDRYRLAQSSDWTWVLVRSEDWKRILSERGMADSPAFTFLEKRETFIEEALLAEVDQRRRVELLRKWQLPADQLLELAVTHELGHAFCSERDEAKADHFGQALRDNKPALCEAHR